MEGFVEQVVKREMTAKNLMIKIMAVALEIILPLFFVMLANLTSVFYLVMVGLFVFIGGLYIVWYVFTSQKVEYEYAVNGDVLDVAKIVSLRKRKRLCRVTIKDIDLLEVGDANIQDMHFRKMAMAAKNAKNTKENYFAVYTMPAYGKCLLVFNPNENILQAMKPHMKKELMIKLFYRK